MIVDVNGWYTWFLPWKETINKSPTLRYEFIFFIDRYNSEPAADENKESLNIFLKNDIVKEIQPLKEVLF